MNHLALIPLALVLTAAPALAAPRALTVEERAALRCGAAFATVAAGQARGDAAMKQYPPMASRGREFFVRLSAKLMDDAGMTEGAVAAAARAEADGLKRDGGPARIMPFCLRMLNAQPAFTR